MLDKKTIRMWWDVLKKDYVDNGGVVEIRIFHDNAIYSGYFTDVEKMLVALAPFENDAIYATLNPCVEACMSRKQGDCIIKAGKNPTTSANDILGREFILIDIDPVRPAGTNASDMEKEQAKKVMFQVYKYLADQGFNNPIVADSANGYHLYYRVHIENAPDKTELISNFLKVLDMYFSSEAANIDVAVCDPNRIVKVIGTGSNKGRSTALRPQRISSFISAFTPLKSTDIAFVRKVSSELLVSPNADRSNNYSNEAFDLDAFIEKHGIEVEKRSSFKGGEKIVLKQCPFDSQHQSAAFFHSPSGAIAFKCFHNSCSQYGWRDVRLKFEPSAYNNRDRRDYDHRHRYDRREKGASEIIPETTEIGSKWLNPSSIKWVDPKSFTVIPTGIEKLDSIMLGLTMGDVTIVSGLAGSGKTSLLDNIILNSVDKGFKVAAWSGELQDFRFISWLDQMAAGRANVQPQVGYQDIYYAPRRYAEKINHWLDDKFWLYNNNYGNKYSQLMNDIEQIVEQHHPDLIIVDNLTALELDSSGDEKNDRQKTLIVELKNFAKAKNIHVMLVAHPRKEQSFHMLRMESISGSSDLINLCDNVLIVHRGGNDLQKRMTEFFSATIADEYSKYDTVIEIAKNRSHGRANTLIGMYYEPETRRFLNSIEENRVYGWDDSVPQDVQIIFEDMPDFNN